MNLNLETKIFLGVSLGTLLAVVLAGVLLGKGNTSSPEVLASAQVLIPENSNSIGPSDAKVTIVEFSDFECPACKTAEHTVQKVLEEYKDKIRFVYRNYPIPTHEFGMVAAQAAQAASLQGRFWDMHKILFDKSPELSKDKIITYAMSLGLDAAKFAADMDSDAVKASVVKGQDDGNAVGVEVTPTFFINGTKFSGALSLAQFEQEINSRLK